MCLISHIFVGNANAYSCLHYSHVEELSLLSRHTFGHYNYFNQVKNYKIVPVMYKLISDCIC